MVLPFWKRGTRGSLASWEVNTSDVCPSFSFLCLQSIVQNNNNRRCDNFFFIKKKKRLCIYAPFSHVYSLCIGRTFLLNE